MEAENRAGRTSVNTSPLLTNANAELDAALRVSVAQLTTAVGVAGAELKTGAQLARDLRLAEEKLAAEKRQMADQSRAEQAEAKQATRAAEARLTTLTNQIAKAERDLEARQQAGQSTERRLKFIRDVISELAEHGMTVWNLEERGSDEFKIQFDATKKLTIGAPPEAGAARSTSRGQFRQLIKIITDLEDKNMPVRLLSYTSGDSLEITYTRKERNLVIRPKAKDHQ